MRRETRLLHYGREAGIGPANPPVVRASTILHDTVTEYRDTKSRRETDDAVLSYGRRGTTTAHVLSAAIADMEGGEACYLFPTGVAALAGALSAYLSAGDHALVVDTVFPPTRVFCDTVLKRGGVSVDYIPFDADDLGPWRRPETKVLFVESPGSQTFEVMDLPKLTARAEGLTVIADNTYGSGWLYRPLELGCDVSVIAGTKYLGGHADLMMGAVSATGAAVGPLREHVHRTGQTLSPDDAYACLRGMRTLDLRLDRHDRNAMALARWFADRPQVRSVLHPGLPECPGHGIWQRDASGSTGLFSVEFEEGFAAERFADALTLFAIGSSWGGFESLAMPVEPDGARTRAPRSPRGPMLRLHAGLEHVDDLLEDVAQAMGSVAPP